MVCQAFSIFGAPRWGAYLLERSRQPEQYALVCLVPDAVRSGQHGHPVSDHHEHKSRRHPRHVSAYPMSSLFVYHQLSSFRDSAFLSPIQLPYPFNAPPHHPDPFVSSVFFPTLLFISVIRQLMREGRPCRAPAPRILDQFAFWRTVACPAGLSLCHHQA